MRIFNLTKDFPKEEIYSLSDQIRRASRSVTANIAEAWAKRRYEASFISKLTDAAGEAAETTEWLNYSTDCGYLDPLLAKELGAEYESVQRTLNAMMLYSESWCSRERGYKPQATSTKVRQQITSNKQQATSHIP